MTSTGPLLKLRSLFHKKLAYERIEFWCAGFENLYIEAQSLTHWDLLVYRWDGTRFAFSERIVGGVSTLSD